MKTLTNASVSNWKHLQSVLLILFIASLTGCGFQLKQSAAIPASFGPVSISGIAPYSSLFKSMRNAMRQSSVEVISESDSANHKILIKNARSDRRVLSVDSDGKAAEYELTQSLTFSVTDSSNNVLIEPQKLSVNYFYTSSRNDVLSDNTEEDDLKLRMENNLVDRMLRIISAQI